jgi:hypothetical protein
MALASSAIAISSSLSLLITKPKGMFFTPSLGGFFVLCLIGLERENAKKSAAISGGTFITNRRLPTKVFCIVHIDIVRFALG